MAKRQDAEDVSDIEGLKYFATATFKDSKGVYYTYTLKFNPLTKKAQVVNQRESSRLLKDEAMALMEAKKELVDKVFHQILKEEA